MTTDVVWTPDPSAYQHRLLLSLPGNPPYEEILPKPDGSLTTTFTPPETETMTEDTSEVWFECQPLPVNPRVDPFIFWATDPRESTTEVKVIKFRSDVGTLTFIADLRKPFTEIFDKLTYAQIRQVCGQCGIDVVSEHGKVIDLNGEVPADRVEKRALQWAAAGAAAGEFISNPVCRSCVKQVGLTLIGENEAQQREAERRAREAREERERQEWKQQLEQMQKDMDRTRGDFAAIDRANAAAERHEQWERMGRNIA